MKSKQLIRARDISGFTLVELMITILLSLMITYAIAQVLISSNRSSVTSDGQSQSQETGRFVMSYLANQIRQAGLDSLTNDSRTTDAIISCSDFAAPGLIGTTGDLACTTDSSTQETELSIYNPGTRGDRLALAWIPPVPLNAGGNPDATLITDCTGRGGYLADEIVLNVFWVAPDNNGMNSLMCQGHTFDGSIITRSSDVRAIANGVDSLQLLFGESLTLLPASGERNVTQYVNADGITANNWDQVYAIKVAIMTRSITEDTLEKKLRSYALLDSPPYLMYDEVSRQVFTTTFAINNYQ